MAEHYGFATLDLQGRGFRHLAFAAGLSEPSDALHVYVEHDGSPWIDAAERPANDPTPRNPLALELMARDRGPRLYLGRPCYFQPRPAAECTPLLWTHRRYAPEIVASMVAALREFMQSHSFARVVLIGHSGGGTLAWLMAREMGEVTAVYTVAANLAVERWATLHGFTPLVGSLDPAALPDLNSTVVQVHYAGGRDRDVPAALLHWFAQRHGNARVVVMPEFDHVCCWVAHWPELLRYGGSANLLQ